MRARNRQARECPALPPRRLRGGRRTADTRGDQLVHAVAPCENGARFRSRKVSRACSYPPGHARRCPMSQRLDHLDLPADDVRALGGKLLDLAAQWLAGEPQAPVLAHLGGDQLAALFDEPPPEHGAAAEALLAEMRDKVLVPSRLNSHPRQVAVVCATPDSSTPLATLLVSMSTQN